MSGLLLDGLKMTVIGMAIVFAALAALWGVMALLMRIFAPGAGVELATGDEDADVATLQISQAEATAADELTAERARVAALVAGMLMANSLPLLFEGTVGSAFEHGRTAPAWVSQNRARALHSWQPPRTAGND
jgi:Na+-transporting methylmalonyl-CoA/oxaloacetate decarboxylase gamma subunit